MNKLKYILFFIAFASITFSCSKALELGPEDYFGEGNFWQN